MIKRLCILMLLILGQCFELFSQDINSTIIKDTIIDDSYCYCKILKNRTSDLEFVECYHKRDSLLTKTFTKVKNIVNGIVVGYSDGKLKTIQNYFNGLPCGKFESYYSNGNLFSIGNFEYIQKDSVYRDGVIFLIEDIQFIKFIEFSNSPKVGKWTYYNENGTKNLEGIYLNNKKIGLWYRYDNQGKIIDKHNYDIEMNTENW